MRSVSQKIVGIHLSGSNARRTCMVCLAGNPLTKPLDIIGLYEKIGSHGKLFSDERVVGLLEHLEPLQGVYVDCPLTSPPCVACQRLACPGVVACEDIGVAYMLALTVTIKKLGARKRRPINPQSQRLWDVAYESEVGRPYEPTYSANQAPLVVRAQTLQRRLNGAIPGLQLRETHVGMAVQIFGDALSLKWDPKRSYRSFESGKELRRQMIEAMVDKGWILASSACFDARLWRSVDVFQAFIAALSGSFVEIGQTQERPIDFIDDGGWVYLPEPEV